MPASVGHLWWAYLGIGLASGVFSATFGVGSGVILIPSLVLFCHFEQKSAQGVCLAVMVPMALVGAIRYGSNPAITLDLRVAAVLACGAMVGAYIGADLASRASGVLLRRLFAVILAIAAVQLLRYKPPPSPATPAPAAVAPRENTDA